MAPALRLVCPGMVLTSLGVDIGGSGIKAGVVDVTQGMLVGERVRVPTPQPATPDAVVGAVADLVAGFRYDGPVGIGFPSVVEGGVVWTANNIDRSWIGVNALDAFGSALGREVGVINDADAAAICEARYGAARAVSGLVLVLTFGTGIGSGMLHDGRLIPNVEVGGMELEGHERAEFHFSDKARKAESLSWEEWGERTGRFLHHMKLVFAPRLIVIGGGVVSDWNKWSRHLPTDLRVLPATRGNHAGIVGAATLVG